MKSVPCLCQKCNASLYVFTDVTKKIKTKLTKHEIGVDDLAVIKKDTDTGQIYNFYDYVRVVRDSLQDYELKSELRRFLRKQYVVIKSNPQKPPVTPLATPPV